MRWMYYVTVALATGSMLFSLYLHTFIAYTTSECYLVHARLTCRPLRGGAVVRSQCSSSAVLTMDGGQTKMNGYGSALPRALRQHKTPGNQKQKAPELNFI